MVQAGLDRSRSPDGEIGRHSGLKIRREQSHGGSSPPPGTKSKRVTRYLGSIRQENYSVNTRLTAPLLTSRLGEELFI